MNNPQLRSSSKLTPIGSPSQPLHILPQELITGRPGIHERMGERHGGMMDRTPAVEGQFGLFEEEGVCFVGAVEEFEVELDGEFSREDGVQVSVGGGGLSPLGEYVKKKYGKSTITDKTYSRRLIITGIHPSTTLLHNLQTTKQRQQKLLRRILIGIKCNLIRRQQRPFLLFLQEVLQEVGHGFWAVEPYQALGDANVVGVGGGLEQADDAFQDL